MQPKWLHTCQSLHSLDSSAENSPAHRPSHRQSPREWTVGTTSQRSGGLLQQRWSAGARGKRQEASRGQGGAAVWQPLQLHG
eukprot:COSAG01_NODE_1479_length_10161_cov_138.934109_4_plen_82_part_00